MVVVRRDLLLDAGGFDETLSFGEEWECWIRLALRAPAVFVPHPLVGYFLHEEGGSVVTEWRHPDLVTIEERYAAQRAELGVELDWNSHIFATASRLMFAGRLPFSADVRHGRAARTITRRRRRHGRFDRRSRAHLTHGKVASPAQHSARDARRDTELVARRDRDVIARAAASMSRSTRGDPPIGFVQPLLELHDGRFGNRSDTGLPVECSPLIREWSQPVSRANSVTRTELKSRRSLLRFSCTQFDSALSDRGLPAGQRGRRRQFDVEAGHGIEPGLEIFEWIDTVRRHRWRVESRTPEHRRRQRLEQRELFLAPRSRRLGIERSIVGRAATGLDRMPAFLRECERVTAQDADRRAKRNTPSVSACRESIARCVRRPDGRRARSRSCWPIRRREAAGCRRPR